MDAGRLIEWMTWARPEGHKRGLNGPERGYESFTGKQYPWLMANVSYEEPGHVEASFEREFPQVVRYAQRFPFKGVRVIVLIAQRSRADVHLHTDSDGYWGFRFYLARRREDALYFCMAREGMDELPRKVTDWSPYLDQSKRYYASWPEEERAYCVNSARAAHSVDAKDCQLGERIACLVLPKEGLDEERLLRLLDESSAQFGRHQIWCGPQHAGPLRGPS